VTFSKFSLTLLALAAVTSLTACGGGGGDSSNANPAPNGTQATAEGVYTGTLTGADASSFAMVVLEDGTYWTIAGNVGSDGYEPTSLIQGKGTSNAGKFNSSNGHLYAPELAGVGTLNATYSTSAISGSANANGTSIGFSGERVTAAAFDYDKPASLSSVTGNWTIRTALNDIVPISIEGNGHFTGASIDGCTMSGTVTPRASGKNVFDMTLTFGPAPCALANVTGSGIATTLPYGSGQSLLVIAGVDSSLSGGMVAAGVR